MNASEPLQDDDASSLISGMRWSHFATALRARSLGLGRQHPFMAGSSSVELAEQIQLRRFTPVGGLHTQATGKDTGHQQSHSAGAGENLFVRPWRAPNAEEVEQHPSIGSAKTRIFNTNMAIGITPVAQIEPQIEPQAESQMGTQMEPIFDVVAHSPFEVPNERSRNFLSTFLGVPVPAVKVFTGQNADQVARQWKADALTFGENILFRHGKYEPNTAQGMALLGHEMTHVAHAGRADSSRTVEEERAHDNERQLLRYLTAPTPTPASPQAIAPTSRSAPGAALPMTAPVERIVGTPSPAVGESGPPQLTERQLATIKDAVYRDLLQRMRVEFERVG